MEIIAEQQTLDGFLFVWCLISAYSGDNDRLRSVKYGASKL